MVQIPISETRETREARAAMALGKPAAGDGVNGVSLPPQAGGSGIDPADLELVHPFTGEIIDPKNADQLIDAYEQLKEVSDRAYGMLTRLKLAMAELTEGSAKTRRLQGKRRKAKIEMPSDGWDQSILREAWHSFPQLREQVLKIDTIGVKMVEYKKLVNTSGAPEVETFRNMVTAANRGPCGNPSVKVEL